MAIRKCPYCKAIIDEDALYCANCGTQLLFPENEKIEEQIPGDKITDDVSGKKEERDTENELVETPKEDEVEWRKKLFLREETGEEEEKEEELEKREEPQREEDEQKEEIEEIGEVGEKAFDTADLDKIESPGEIDKEEIEGIISGLKKKEKEEGEIEEEKIEPEEELPPWVEQIKKAPQSDIRGEEEKGEEEEEREEEEIPQPEERFEVSEKEVDKDEEPAVDTGIGVPEEEQKGLPFVEEEEAAEEVIDTEEKFQPPSRFSFKVKARAFDVFLITSLWLVTVWLASRLIEVSLFKLISVSSLPIFIFYLILLVSYFSLFLFFLGRTLGDRLFLPES